MSTWPLTFFLCLNNNFETKNFDVLRRRFDRNLISPNISMMCRNHCLICACHKLLGAIFTLEILSFSSHKIFLSKRLLHCALRFCQINTTKVESCSKQSHQNGAILMERLWIDFNFGCVYLTETHAQWGNSFCIWKREAVVECFKFVILEPFDPGNHFYIEKTLKNIQCHPTWPYVLVESWIFCYFVWCF